MQRFSQPSTRYALRRLIDFNEAEQLNPVLSDYRQLTFQCMIVSTNLILSPYYNYPCTICRLVY